MAIPSFFKQNKPRGFNYVPRYYDPQKEEWEQKRMARSMEQGEDSTEHREESAERRAQSTDHRAQSGERKEESGERMHYRSKIMRGSMKNYFPRNRDRVQQQNMIRFVVILLILLFVLYIYLRY